MNTLEIRDLSVTFGRGAHALKAVDGVSLQVPRGSVVGVVGESGSGKSTLARAVVGLVSPSGGSIVVNSETQRHGRGAPAAAQMIFQDPFTSLDPRMPVGAAVAEGLLWRRTSAARRREEVVALLATVSLDETVLDRLPHEISGGQLQRVAIARALATRPELLVADEITSALDVSVQAAVLNVLRGLQRDLGLSVLFVSHNLGVVRYISDVVAVMYLGQIVEVAPTEQLVADPRHPYTRTLLEAVPTLNSQFPDLDQTVVEHDPPDPHASAGCRFHSRCPVGPLMLPDREVCVELDPVDSSPGRPHHAACHFA